MLNLYNSSGTILISGRGMDLRTFQGHSQDQESLRAAKTVLCLQQCSTLSGWPSYIASDPPISPEPEHCGLGPRPAAGPRLYEVGEGPH